MKQPSNDRSRLRRPAPNRVSEFCVGLIAACALLLFPAMAGAAPANDTCAGAIQMPAAAPFLTAVLDISTATLTGDPPVPDFYTNKLSRSVWYRFTPAANALYTISTCASLTGTTINDTVMG